MAKKRMMQLLRIFIMFGLQGKRFLGFSSTFHLHFPSEHAFKTTCTEDLEYVCYIYRVIGSSHLVRGKKGPFR